MTRLRRMVAGAAICSAAVGAPPASAQSLLEIDQRALVARADLTYDTPASRPEEGMPIGNGRMGSLIWTTPSALRLQINRVDVHAMDSTTVSFPRADSDYGGGCGYVDIHVAGAADDVFAGAGFRQRLSLYDALVTTEGNGVTARALAWPGTDVVAIEIDDRRGQPDPIQVDLRMLRYQIQYENGQNYPSRIKNAVTFRTAAHTATSTLGVHAGRITLTQQFREGNYYGASAVAIAVVGRPSRARYLNETTVQLSSAAGRGRFVILIASAANKDATQDATAVALDRLTAAGAKGFDGLARDTADWWRAFWERGSVSFHSEDGQADFVEASYTYFLYLMGASSRGDYPPRFGGLLWRTDGDMSRWGSQYWWANTYAYYSNLMPSNRIDLMDPMFKMYFGMHEAAATAARQQWGSRGIWIPETTFFNGPDKLPEDIGAELQDLMLVRKPWEQRSQRFDWYANNKNRHDSRWNFRADGEWVHGYYVFKPKGTGAFGHTSHILGVASRIGNLAWQRYQLTLDEQWLRERAYPFIKGAAEFYRHFPNLRKGEDGRYHVNHTNSGESDWNSRDAPYEVSCMHMIFPLAIRASRILGVDSDLRPAWQEIKDNLVPMPARGRCGTGSEIADDRPFGAFVYNGPGAIAPIGPEPELKARFLGFTRLGSFIDQPGIGGAQIFRNRLRLREGPGAIDAEHLGGLATGIHQTLLNSRSESVADDEPIGVFNRWPKDWDAAFRLLARGGFLISAAHIAGTIPFVEVVSQAGGTCRVENPWGKEATLYRNRKQAEHLSGNILTFPTRKDETVVLVPRGSTPAVVKVPGAGRQSNGAHN